MTRKQKRNLERTSFANRCKTCSRGLKNPLSIHRGYGKKCYTKYQKYLAGLRGLAARENN